MKLLYTVNSPYARKVRVVAAEKHIDIELELVNLSDANNAVKQYNPLGKVPVLILANGECLYDSTVIVEYLDKSAPSSNLIPMDQSIKIKRWEALADGICDAAVAVMQEQRRAETMQDNAHITKQMDKVKRGLETLEHDLGEHKWCVNGKYSLADIAVGCMLGYVHLRVSDKIAIHHEFPNLARLQTTLLTRPIFAQTQPVV